MQEIAIIGAGGFTGKELLHIVERHRELVPVFITSNAYAGKKVKEVFPDLESRKTGELVFQKHTDPVPENIPVMLATPNQDSMELVKKLYHRERIIIDLSGAYRIDNPEIFSKFYGFTHKYPELLREKVYGIPEIFREQIRKAKIIANPGCYPVSVLIPLYYFRKYLHRAAGIFIDSKSGVSGAGGRVEDSTYAFHNVYENFRAYKVLQHQHQPEIQQYLYQFSSFQGTVTFVPHLLPMFRGILSSITIFWNDSIDDEEVFSGISEEIKNEPFVRLYRTPEEIHLRNVQHTNFCDFSFRSYRNVTVIVSAIDNLQKGAAGQAIQNLNLTLGFSESEGLL